MLAPLGPCLVDAGGDVAARGGLSAAAGWPVGVADPLKPGSRVTTLTVYDRGIATSGIDYRNWRRRGVDMHHLIDPRTQRPVHTDLITATVIAPDVAWADLHALVVMLLGRENGQTWLLQHPELEGLLVDRSGRVWRTPGLVAYEHRAAEPVREVQL
jgi:thiamine biosynthesis lipoprotein